MLTAVELIESVF